MLACDGNMRFPEAPAVGRKPPPVFRPPFGMPNCGVLVRLKNSARNCSFRRSINEVLKERDIRIVEPGAVQYRSTGVAVVASLRNRRILTAHDMKGVGIKPLVDGLVCQ